VTHHHIEAMDKNTKNNLDDFIQLSMQHYGGFKVWKSSLVGSSSIPTSLLPSSCMIMIYLLSFFSISGPSFLSNINTSDLGNIIFSRILEEFIETKAPDN
jgi:hypothetical protein